jgi:serine/threonine protein kinase
MKYNRRTNKKKIKYKQMKKTMKKTKNLKGGKFLGQGSFGCVISPAITCDKNKHKYNSNSNSKPNSKTNSKTKKISNSQSEKYVSKIIISPDEEDKDEIIISNKLKNLDPKQKYFITFEDACRIKELPSNRSNTVKVKYRNNSLEKYVIDNKRKYDKESCKIDLKLKPINIIMPYGGYDLTHILDKKRMELKLILTRKMLFKYFKECFKHLLIGIKKMHDSRIVNRDIKMENIMINYMINKPNKPNTTVKTDKTNRNESQNIKIRFIDFGLSSILTPSYCEKMSNIDIRGTPGAISPELFIAYNIYDNKNYSKIKEDININIKKVLDDFKNSKLTYNYDNTILELYKKIINEFKTKDILKTFFGTDTNKYNGYLQKGDIFALGITMYDFIDYYNYKYKNSETNIQLNNELQNAKLADLLYNMVNINTYKRYNIIQCLQHSYFTNK